MPFCRECGKEVQDDWKTCPHCSCSLTESSQSISIQDSAVGGDVVINDSKAISSAVQSASKCVSCGSKGVTQIACSKCKEMSHCNVCESELDVERKNERLCDICYKNYVEEEEMRDRKERIRHLHLEQEKEEMEIRAAFIEMWREEGKKLELDNPDPDTPDDWDWVEGDWDDPIIQDSYEGFKSGYLWVP